MCHAGYKRSVISGCRGSGSGQDIVSQVYLVEWITFTLITCDLYLITITYISIITTTTSLSLHLNRSTRAENTALLSLRSWWGIRVYKNIKTKDIAVEASKTAYLDEFVIALIRAIPHFEHSTIQRSVCYKEIRWIIYVNGASRWCQSVNREHSYKRLHFCTDKRNGVIFQKCPA